MKKVLKWSGVVVGAIVALLLLLCLLFYFPPFQRWAVGQASRIASEKSGMQISVGYVRLAFPLDLSLENVKVLEPNDSLKGVNDTVADMRRMVASVQLWPLLHKQVMVDELSLRRWASCGSKPTASTSAMSMCASIRRCCATPRSSLS